MKLCKQVVSGALAVVTALSMAVAMAPQIAKADGYDTGIPEFRSASIEASGLNAEGKLTKDSTITVKCNAWDNVGITKVTADLWLFSKNNEQSNYYKMVKYTADVNSTSEIQKDGDNYSYTFSLSDWDFNGNVRCDYIIANDAAGNCTYYYFYNNNQTCNWEIVGATDVPAYQSSVENITDYSISITDQNGKQLTDGQVINSGTTINYEVTINSSIPDSVNLLSATQNTGLAGTSKMEIFYLNRVDTTNKFKGSFTFTDSMYPTLWIFENPNFGCSDTEKTYILDTQNADIQGDELILKVGNQVIYPTASYSFNMQYWIQEGNGYAFKEEALQGNAVYYTKASELGISLPEIKLPDGSIAEWHVYDSVYDSATKTETEVDLGKFSDFTFKRNRSNSCYYDLKPDTKGYRLIYLKYPTIASYSGEEYYTFAEKEFLVKGSTEEELRSNVLVKAKEISTKDLGSLSIASEEINLEKISRFEITTENIPVCLEREYLALVDGELTYGRHTYKTVFVNRKNPISLDQVLTIDDSSPEKVAGINFMSWTKCAQETNEEFIQSIRDANEFGWNFVDINTEIAKYDKDIYRVTYSRPSKSEIDDEACFEEIGEKILLIEKGTSIKEIIAQACAKTVKGYSNWNLIDDNSYEEADENGYGWIELSTESTSTATFDSNGNVISSGSKFELETKTEDQKIETTNNGAVKVTEKVTIGTDDTVTTNGVTALDDSAKAVAVDLISKALEETVNQAKTKTTDTPKVTISMADATVVPTEILEAAKGQDVDVTFEMDGGYSWTINGKNITGSSLKDVNMKVNQNTNNVPASLVTDSLGKDTPSIQINLADHGLFGFTADLKFYVGKEYAGKYANLFYYTDGRLEVQNSHLVDSEGYAVLTFSHASDYVIAMGEDMTKAATTAPKTSDSSDAMPFVLLLMIGVACFLVTRKSRISL